MSGRQPGSPGEIAGLLARFGNSALTYARPLDITQLLPSGYALDEAGRSAVMKIAEETLDEFLSHDGVYWRGTGLDYWILFPNCAQAGLALKWNAITGCLFHRLRERLGGAAQPYSSPGHNACLSVAQFCQAVDRHRKTGRTPLVQDIDLREVLFGPASPDIRVSRRVWSMVETILDGYFHASGHYTRMEGDRIGLFMPALGASLAALKRDVIIREIRQQLTGGTEQKAATLNQRAAAPTPPPASPQPEASGEEKAIWTQTFQAMLAALPVDAAAVIGDGTAATRRYEPVCRVRQGLIIGNLLRIDRADGGRQEEGLPEETRADFLAVADAVRLLRMEEDKQERPDGLLIVPVRFSTLDRLSARTIYLTLCTQIPEKRRNRLVFQLNGIPCDLRALRLDERLRQLRPFCRNVVVGTDISRNDFTQFEYLSSRLVGVDLTLYQAAPTALGEALLRFGRQAQAAGFRPYAHGVTSAETAAAAIQRGFEFLSGEAIAGTQLQPLGFRPYVPPALTMGGEGG